MVDPSLLRQAADRGVTIAFADLDGADGLWVPEERTVLVSRGLPEDRVAEVIEHELAHVRIDDQHADLDAGKDVLIGRPAPSRRPAAAALAAASLVVLIGGIAYGVHAATGDTKRDQVAPNPDGPGLTADESGAPSTTVIPSIGPDGRIHYRTVTVTEAAPVPRLSGTPTVSPSAVPSGTRTAPERTTGPTAAPPARGTTSAAPRPVDSTTNPPVTTTEPETTTPEVPPTTPADESGAAGGDDGAGVGDGGLGDQGTGTGLGSGTEAAGASGAVDPSAVTAVGSTTP